MFSINLSWCFAFKNTRKNRWFCPSIFNAINSSALPSTTEVNEMQLLPKEGLANGDTLAMGMYGIRILPVISLHSRQDATQKCYADDCNACGVILSLRSVFDSLKKHGAVYWFIVLIHEAQLLVKATH